MDDAAEQIIAIRFQGIQDAPKLFAEATAAILKMDQALQELQRHQGVMQAQIKSAPPQQQEQIHEQIKQVQRVVEKIQQQQATAEAQAGVQQTRKQEYDRLRPLAQPSAAEGAAAGGAASPGRSSSGGAFAASASGGKASPSGPSEPETGTPSVAKEEKETKAKEVPKSLWGKMWSNLFSEEGGINTGYALMTLGQGAAQAAELTMTGNRVTPEARARAGYGLLPGIGALAGSAFGWAGSLAGQGIGTIAQGFLDADSQKNEKIRLAADEMSAALGRGTEASQKFAAVISDAASKAGTPVVELAQTLTELSRTVAGFNVMAASPLQAQLQSSLGDLYAPVMQSAAQFQLANPLAFGYRKMMAGGPVGDNYADAAIIYALQGNLPEAQKQLMANEASHETPEVKSLKARIGRLNQKPGFFSVQGMLANGGDPIEGIYHAIQQANQVNALNDELQKAQSGPNHGLVTDTTPLAKLVGTLDTLQRTTGAQAQVYGLQAGVSSTAAGTQLALGHGAAGEDGDITREVVQLSQQRKQLESYKAAILVQANALQKRNDPNAPAVFAMADAVSDEIEKNKAQSVSAIVDQFHQVLSEGTASYEGRMSILGSRNASLTGRGVAVTDPRLIHAFAAQKGTLAERASYLRVLANDHTNSLSPEERQQYLAQAAQLTEQGMVGIPNEIFNRQQSEQAARQGLRMSRADLGFATAMTGGGVGDVVRAQQAKLAENLKQQNEAAQDIVTLSKLGIGTYQQRLQLETQLNALQSQEVLLKQQYTEQTYQLSLGQTQGAAGAGAALAKRLMFGAGTSGLTYSASSQSLIAERGAVEQLRQRASDPTLDPKTLMQRLKDFQEAAARLDQDTVSGLGSYSESPLAMRQRQAYEGAAARMTLSPFEPGNRLGIDAALNKLDTDKLAGIAAQIRRVRGDTGLTAAQKSNVLMALESQQEQTQTGMAQRSAGFASQMFSDQISMSVNAPSFASRLLPSPADISRIAERRGLGPMSARVFGFTSRNTYDQTMMYGMAPADQDMMMYGRRPGDVNSVGSMGNFGSDAIGQAIDSASLASQMSELTAAVKTLSQHGFHVQVDVTNPDTGHTASKTVNALKHGDSRAIQRGGAANQSH